ncbi:MAG: DUF3185 domain-containing protein [Ignavibacteria bacterium]|nr:DUF3185 domain-containing protein [Ignavibacteria bacterium]
MRASTIIGIILIVGGILGFIFKGISYTEKEQIVDVGPIEIESEEKETIPIPEILSGIAVVGGIVLVAVGSKKKS